VIRRNQEELKSEDSVPVSSATSVIEEEDIEEEVDPEQDLELA
jgi:hypothetical protein